MRSTCYAAGMTGRDLSQIDSALRAALEATQTIAIVGASPHPWRAAHGIMRYCQKQGYRCFPVNPNHDGVLGEPCYPRLSELPEPVQLINVFRQLDAIPSLVDEILALPWRPVWVWLQEGLRDAPNMQRLMDVGIDVVQDRCLYKEHWRLIGIARELERQ
ncbi:MAG: putative protein YccU [bacterium]|nr:putative protein YccU [bacterium]